MKDKKFKPSLKDTARRAKIITDIKAFEKSKNVSNEDRLKKGVDAPVRIPITPKGGHRDGSENHGKFGAVDIGIAHLPDDVQAEFIEFMTTKGHRVYDERDDISKDPKKQALGLRAGIVHVDDNVDEKVADPEKNYVKEFGQGGDGSYTGGSPGSQSSFSGGYGGGRGDQGGHMGQSYSDYQSRKSAERAAGERASRGGGGRSGGTPRVDWQKKAAAAEAARAKIAEEAEAYREKTKDYEDIKATKERLMSVPFAEQRKQLSRTTAAAQGLTPSQAEAAMKRTEERQLQQMLAATKGQRGAGASRMRGLRRMGEKAAGRTAEMGALMRMKEKAMAEQALSGQISEMTSQALKDKWQKAGLDVSVEIAKIQAEASKFASNTRARMAASQAQGQMVGGLLGGLGTIAGFAMFGGSDKNMKKKVKREDLYKNEYGDVYPGYEEEKGSSKIHTPVKVTPQDVLKKKTKRRKAVKYEKGEPKDFHPQKFLDALKPHSFEYKDKFKKNPMGGEGRFLGVMAQELEKAGPVGKSMVQDTPMGKLVNYGKGFGAVLAAQAHLNQRLKALESKKKKRK